MVEPGSSIKIRLEFEGTLGLTIQLILQIFITTGIVLMDWVFSQSLQIIADNSKITYEQEGFHDLNVTVKGRGFVANLVRTTVDGFDLYKEVDFVSSNESCLPRARFLEDWYT